MGHPSDHSLRWADLRELARSRHGVVGVDEALACGCSRSALNRAIASGELVRLAPRTCAVPALMDDRSHLAAACISEPGAVGSHRAAALLLGLDGVTEDVVEITTTGDRRPRRGLVHRSADLLARDLTVIDGIPATNATRTSCDIGAVVPVNVVERVVESALRLRLTTQRRLETRARELSRRGRAGPAAVRQVLDLRGAQPATESDFETLAIQCLRAGGVPEPERQHVVRHQGRFIARADLAWPSAMVYAELDSRKHHETWEDGVRDRRRQNAMTRGGWLPLRFTWWDVVHDGPATAALTRSILEERVRRAG